MKTKTKSVSLVLEDA